MRKSIVWVLTLALLMVAAPLLAAGGKVHGDKGQGATTAMHNTTGNPDGAPGYVWW